MNESDVSKRIREAFVSLGAVAWKVSDRFHASRPDLIICYKGHFTAIEVKIAPAKPTALQYHTLDELQRADATVYVASYNKVSKSITVLDYLTKIEQPFVNIRTCVQWLLRHRC